MSKRALVVLSGGQDSTSCLFYAKATYDEVMAVTFNYNQRHSVEIEAATQVAQLAEVTQHEIIDMGPILKGTSPLVSEQALEQYPNHQSLPGGLEKTFVPMRNQLFLTVAANRAYVWDCGYLVTGVCQEDFGGYPDCREQFIRALQKATALGTFTGQDGAPPELQFDTPLMYLTKAESIDFAIQHKAYHALAYSHTSYDGQYPPTGHDHATLLRAKGFEQADLPDPLVLRAHQEGLMELPATPNYAKESIDLAFDICMKEVGSLALDPLFGIAEDDLIG